MSNIEKIKKNRFKVGLIDIFCRILVVMSSKRSRLFAYNSKLTDRKKGWRFENIFTTFSSLFVSSITISTIFLPNHTLKRGERPFKCMR